MKTLKFLLAIMIAAALTTTVSCNKDDNDDLIIVDPPEGKKDTTIIEPPEPPQPPETEPTYPPTYLSYVDQNSKFDTYPSECTEIGKSEERMACHNSSGLYTANPGEIATSLYQRDGDNLIFRIHKADNKAFKADGTAYICLGTPNEERALAKVAYKEGDLYVEIAVTINGNGEFGRNASQSGYQHGFALYFPMTQGVNGDRYYATPLKVYSKDGLSKVNSHTNGEVVMFVNGVEVRYAGTNNQVSGTNGSSATEWCTKLPFRYYKEVFGYTLYSYGNAKTWSYDYKNFPEDLFDRIENKNSAVRINDIIIYDKGDAFGHIGIVMEVYPTYIKVIEQNGGSVFVRELQIENGVVVSSLGKKGITFMRPHSLFGTEIIPPIPPEITACAIGSETIGKNSSFPVKAGENIEIKAVTESDCEIHFSVNNDLYIENEHNLYTQEGEKYTFSVWSELNGQKSETYDFIIVVQEEGEVKAPAITQCTVNNNKVGNHSCADAIEYGKNVTISATAESNDCDIKISVKGNDYNKEVTKKSYTFSNLEPGDYSVEVWTEKDGKQSNKYEFSITIKEEEDPPVSVKIESNISFGSYLPSVSENSFIYIKYNGEKIRLQGDEGCELSVKAVYEGNTIKFIAAKSFRQDGVAVLYENGFTTKVDSKSYHQYDTEVIFEIDSKNITDKTEYRIALVTDCNDNGYKYKAGYYTAPLVLNRAGDDANRSYSVSPSTGRFLTDIASNNLKTIKASNNKPSYLVDGNAGCDTKIKVQSVNGNTVTLLCTKDGGFRVPGRMIVYEGSSPEQLWYGNIFAEKSYRGNNTQDEVTLKLDVSHITSSTKFGVVILSDEGDGNGTMYGYYTGTITVTPR